MHPYTLCLPGGSEHTCHARDEGAARHLFKQMTGHRSHLPTGSIVFLGFRVRNIYFA